MSITTIFYTAVGRVSTHYYPQRRRIHWRRGYFGTCVASRPYLRRCGIPQLRASQRLSGIELTKSPMKGSLRSSVRTVCFALDATRHIAPTVIVGGTTIALIYFSNSISRKRLAALGCGMFHAAECLRQL